MAHMHTTQLASAQPLQHRGHFEFLNYLVVFGRTGRMCLIPSEEGREGEPVIFLLFCEEVGAWREKEGAPSFYCGREECVPDVWERESQNSRTQLDQTGFLSG